MPALQVPDITNLMARQKRFELLTPRFVVWCSWYEPTIVNPKPMQKTDATPLQ